MVSCPLTLISTGGFGTVRLAIIQTDDSGEALSADFDDIRDNRFAQDQKGRKVSRSIDHMSTAPSGSLCSTSVGSDVPMKDEAEEKVEMSKFAKKGRAPSPKKETLKKANTFKIRANQLCALKIISKRQVLETQQ